MCGPSSSRRVNPTSEPECQPERIQGLHQLTIAEAVCVLAGAGGGQRAGALDDASRMPRAVTTIWFLPSGLRADFTASLPVTIYSVVTGQRPSQLQPASSTRPSLGHPPSPASGSWSSSPGPLHLRLLTPGLVPATAPCSEQPGWLCSWLLSLAPQTLIFRDVETEGM